MATKEVAEQSKSAKRLYLSDAYTDVIHQCSYVGVCSIFYTDRDAYLMDIKLLGDYLYYTAWNKVYVTKLKKTDTMDISKLAEKAEIGTLESLTIFSSSLSNQTVSTACLPNNGRGACSTLCLPKPNGYTCGYEDGIMLLNDEKTCENVDTQFTTTTTSSSASSATLSTSAYTAMSDHEHENKQLPLAAIGGGVGGFVVLVIVTVILVLCFLKRSRTKNKQPSTISLSDTSIIHRENNDGGYLTPYDRERQDPTYDEITYDLPNPEKDYQHNDERLNRDMLPNAPLAPAYLSLSVLSAKPNDNLRFPALNQPFSDSNKPFSDSYLSPIQIGHIKPSNGIYPSESETDCSSQSVAQTISPISTIT